MTRWWTTGLVGCLLLVRSSSCGTVPISCLSSGEVDVPISACTQKIAPCDDGVTTLRMCTTCYPTSPVWCTLVPCRS